MNVTSVPAWTLSCGTTRRKNPFLRTLPSGVLGSVRLARVAEPETNAMPPRRRIGPPATFSWLPENALAASTFLFERSCTATVAATWGFSCVSASIALIFVRLKPRGTPGIALPAFQLVRKMLPQLRWSRPALPAGPVYGPVCAIVASLQFGAAGLATRAGSALATDAAIAATAVTAETAMTMAFLINVPSFVPPLRVLLV